MEIFKLFGSILINNDDADKSIAKTDKNAEGVGNTFSKAVGTAAKWGAGIAIAAGSAALAVLGLATNVGGDLQKALNGLQSNTGAADAEMSGLRDSMLNIYNNNFGESFEDIGATMTLVAQQTGLTGKALEDATTNALLMRDSFDMDVNGSITATNQLMKQFGLTSQQSYNLLAQGAQTGMNSQGDLVDIIKEYSVQFKTMGFSAEEMFNMLSNGAKEGGFSIDVMGDAMKEFNIRSKDGSKTTEGAFASLGLNADNLTTAFSKGGAEGKKAFEDVIAKLSEMKDPMLQNQAGVSLFGTMWEDLGPKAILALGNTEGAISDTTDALAKINEVKYNTFGEAVEGIKRNLTTGILLPISDKILPKLSELSTYFQQNMPLIKQNISDAMSVVLPILDKFGNAFVFIKDNLNWLTPILVAVLAGIVALKIISSISEIMAAWNTVTIIATGITGGMTAAIHACTLAKIADKFETIAIVALYAKDFILSVASGTLALITQGIQWVINTGLKIANTIATGAMTIATGAWNIVCGIATIATWAFGAAVAFLTSPIGLIILAIAALIGVGVLLYRNWDTIKAVAMNVFGAIGGFIGGIISGIASGFKGMVNGVISGLNFMIRALNKLHFTIPDWVPVIGGGGFGFDLPTIPSFAVGTRYLPDDMLIQAHEGEMIVPKEENPYANTKTGDTLPSGGFTIKIEKFINNREQDVEAFAEELQFYMKQKNLGVGGDD